ncbi:MAG TPA: HAMP domain-containing sensor histidine kinase [Polyangiales bacterium]|nr:HAMP domain-containing sensor histidine kinase [Polyangiales bacterium]
MKLKNKLTLAVAGVTICTLASSFALLGVIVRHDEIEDLDRALARQAAKAMARGVGKDGVPALEDGWVEIPEMLEPARRHAAVYDEAGQLLHATRSFEGKAPRFAELGVTLPLPAEGVAVDSGLHSEILRGVVIQVPGTDNVLLYAVSRGAVDRDTTFLYRTLMAMLLGATAVVVLIARWVGERVSRDVGSIAGVARRVAEGDLGARIGARLDNAELNELAADLDHMVHQLDTLVSAQQRFIAHAAHELRSPLTTLQGELQLALRRPREAAEYRQSLDEALLDVSALIALSEDLLTLARVQSEPSRMETASLSDVLTTAMAMTQRRALQAHVAISFVEPPPSALRVRGRRSELARALRNLLDNAIAHSHRDEVVELTYSEDGEAVYISVTDRGPGISEGDAKRIFEPFFRGPNDQARTDIGAGLGLAIAQEIAQRSGGGVSLDQDYRDGARLVLTLPLLAQQGRPPQPSVARG